MIKFASIDNKANVLMVFDTLFNKRDHDAAEALSFAGLHPAQRPYRPG